MSLRRGRLTLASSELSESESAYLHALLVFMNGAWWVGGLGGWMIRVMGDGATIIRVDDAHDASASAACVTCACFVEWHARVFGGAWSLACALAFLDVAFVPVLIEHVRVLQASLQARNNKLT